MSHTPANFSPHTVAQTIYVSQNYDETGRGREAATSGIPTVFSDDNLQEGTN